MVGFSSGGENPHGVKAVTRGQRCAVALWFTLDPLFRELVKAFPSATVVLVIHDTCTCAVVIYLLHYSIPLSFIH
jgi:hypothetical protein